MKSSDPIIPLRMAAGEGFEPSQTESESVVLPLHNPAHCAHCRRHRCYYSKLSQIVKKYFLFLKNNSSACWTVW